MQQVTHHVYVETGFRGCNTSALVTSKGLVMIDSPQLPSQAAQWRQQLAKLGEVRYLINTEPHSDHITGDFFFQMTLIAHQASRESISMTLVSDLKERIKQINPAELRLMENYQLRLPDITFSDRLSLYVGEHTLELMHLPGHTLGQTGVYVPLERVIFTGDNIFYKVQAFMREAEPLLWLESLKKIQALDVDTIVPGHGEVCTKAYIKEQASFIEEWIAAVRGALDKGWTLEEACARISFLDRYPMPPGTEAMSTEIQRINVTRLYQVLSKQANGKP